MKIKCEHLVLTKRGYRDAEIVKVLELENGKFFRQHDSDTFIPITNEEFKQMESDFENNKEIQ